MKVQVPEAIENAYWQSVCDLLNTSPPGKARAYAGTVPIPGVALTDQVLVLEFTFANPAQTGIANGRVDFDAILPATVLSDQPISFMRLVNGADAWVADLDVGLTGQDFAWTFDQLAYPVGSLILPTVLYLAFP